jgi:hypothetical protein
MLLILFISATNYSLSLGFALTFVLGSVALVNVFFASEISPTCISIPPGASRVCWRRNALHHFSDQSAQISSLRDLGRLQRKNAPEKAVDIAPDSRTHTPELSDAQPRLAGDSTGAPANPVPTWLATRLSTWLPDARALVYPEPEEHAPPLPTSGAPSHELEGQGGNEDFPVYAHINRAMHSNIWHGNKSPASILRSADNW